jgi:ribonuclease HI
MSVPTPHFLLYSHGRKEEGEWSFVLQAADGSATFEAADSEPETQGERLELLALVRGLEALDQPSRVTLVTASRYVNRGLAYGLDEWRRNGWTWECFGEMVPVKNRDLWQRVDRAVQFHRVEVRRYRFDASHAGPNVPHAEALAPALDDFHESPEQALRQEVESPEVPAPIGHKSWRRGVAMFRRWTRERFEAAKLSCAQFGTSFLPSPWIN